MTGLQTAAAHESEVQQIEIDQEVVLFDKVLAETGYVPSGSPLAINFAVDAQQTAWVEMLAEAEVTWPEALSLGWIGVQESGWISMLTEVALVTSVEYDISGYSGAYEVDVRTITMEGETGFDPLLLPGSEQESVAISHEGELDSIFIKVSPISLVEIAGSVTISVNSHTSLEGVRIDNEGEDSLEQDGDTTQIEVPEDSALDVSSAWVGLWDSNINLRFTPALEICAKLTFWDYCYELLAFDYDLEVTDTQFEESFDPVDYVFPIPWMSASPTSHDFGEQLIQTTVFFELETDNNGLLDLEGTAHINGDEAFEVWPEVLYAPAESFDGLFITFTPLKPGEYSAVVTLETNDPHQLTVEIPVTGIGITPKTDIDPEGADDDNSGNNIIESVSTCGCATQPLGRSLAPLLLLTVLLPLRRREPAPWLRTSTRRSSTNKPPSSTPGG